MRLNFFVNLLQIEIVTPQGQRFVEQGQSLLALRRCLLTRDWGSLDSKLGAALSAQAEGPETNLAKVFFFLAHFFFFAFLCGKII